jgi:hypothetical protein
MLQYLPKDIIQQVICQYLFTYEQLRLGITCRMFYKYVMDPIVFQKVQITNQSLLPAKIKGMFKHITKCLIYDKDHVFQPLIFKNFIYVFPTYIDADKFYFEKRIYRDFEKLTFYDTKKSRLICGSHKNFTIEKIWFLEYAIWLTSHVLF